MNDPIKILNLGNATMRSLTSFSTIKLAGTESVDRKHQSMVVIVHGVSR